MLLPAAYDEDLKVGHLSSGMAGACSGHLPAGRQAADGQTRPRADGLRWRDGDCQEISKKQQGEMSCRPQEKSVREFGGSLQCIRRFAAAHPDARTGLKQPKILIKTVDVQISTVGSASGANVNLSIGDARHRKLHSDAGRGIAR